MNIAQPLVGAGSYYGKYFLLEKLATGGMGEVFLARQEGPAGFEKILVVKKILNHLTENKEFVELFLGEARLAARMNHRNVVQVFELGEHQGTYFIAMEYVAGKSLREVVDAAGRRKERIPPEIARAIAEQICDGASYAHNLTDITGRSLNIIHRDLNPQNVLLGFGGDVKVIDFGIAKSEISTVKTEAGMIKGKFLYMSPEQSLAKPLDKRSDVFAIGITLYEMLCGQNPFHKSNIVLTLEAIQRTEPSPPSELDPALAPFDPILAKALAKDRERRYADASEMQEDLRRIVLPRASERMTGFLTRLFRSPVEDGNRPPVDSDSLKITGSRNAPATPPSTSAASPGDSATSRTLLVSGPVRKDAGVRITTPRPSPRPPPPPPKKPAALDTAVAEQPPIAVQDRVVAAIEPAPVEAASASGGETTDRIRKPAAVAARRRRLSGRGLWVAFGGGVFASVLLLGALATWAVVDHSPVPKLRRTAFSATTLSRRGTLWVDARELAVTKDAGSVQVEDVRLDFSRSGSVLDLRVQGPPGSIVFVNGVSRGPSPLAGVKLAGQETMLEVRKPGEGPGRPLRLRYREE
ncbi:MAG: serine/threonine protein kinase [Deltaproteobacteria bacterium]|nr:MAG: serine/threonine protein kinase [Deltaproteobacteria bacterium]